MLVHTAGDGSLGHITFSHNYEFDGLKFVPLAHIHKNARGGN